MSYLSTVFEFIQNVCSADQQIDGLLKNIDVLHRENIQIDKQLEESESEHVRLQFNLYNLDSTNSQYDKADIEMSKQTNLKVFEASVDLRNLVAKIDFEKILKCNYLEMEAKCRKECEPIQESMVITAKWHEKMEQRHVVKRYRQAELALKESDVGYKNQQESMEKSLKESLEHIKNTTQRKHEIIVNLVIGSNQLEKLRKEIIQLKQYEEHIEGLNKQKIVLTKQLELSQHKAFNFNPLVPYKSQDLSKATQSLETSNCITMPKFPSFHDILNSFQTAKTEITVIENTTCIKSILHNSMELNQSITTKLTKKVHFKVPLEVYHEDLNTNSEIDTEDSKSDSSQETVINANGTNEEVEEIVEETEEIVDSGSDMETIDLLTPSDNKETQLPLKHIEASNFIAISKEEPVKENMASSKSKIDIQECTIFKAPIPVCKDQKQICQEPSTSNESKFAAAQENSFKTSSNPFYEDFCKTSFSSDMSNSTSSETKVKIPAKRSILKDFDTYFNENREFLFASQSNESKEISSDFIEDSKQNVFPTGLDNKENEAAEQEFIDFGSGNKVGFTFDGSDDNMDENFTASDLDFMFD